MAKRKGNPTNSDRADRIAKIERSYMSETCDTKESFVADLLADIRHYCDENGIDFAREDGMAYQHYTEEKAGRE